MLDERSERCPLFVVAGDLPGQTEDDGRAVVHGVVKRGPRQHKTVEDRRGDAGRDSVSERAQHAARRRAVKVERVAHAGVDRRDDDGIAVDDESDVADDGLVEDGVHGGGVVGPTFRETAHGRPAGLEFGHMF